jgi:uncharacterized membrane protein YedE/YeeE
MSVNWLTLTVSSICLVLWFYLTQNNDETHATLFIISLVMGITLFKGMFGFAGAYKRAFEKRDMSGIYAQIVMLALATLLFAPILSQGYAFDHGVVGAVAPLSVALAIGAFVFGIGMQMGGSCASGSLFVAAGGNRRTLVVLFFFCIGAFVGSLHLSMWNTLPKNPPISLADTYGWEIALPLQLAVLALLYYLFTFLDKGGDKKLWWQPKEFTFSKLIYGSWPLMLTGGILAILNWLTLLVSGHPWSITWAFSLWGAKIAALFGWDPTTSVFWDREFQLNALQQPIWQDETSIMNMGIFIGALLAASIAKKFTLSGSLTTKSLITAIIAGLLMGYGARLAYGCNIGAYFGGISSTSLHGWLWIICAIPGFWLGLKVSKLINK